MNSRNGNDLSISYPASVRRQGRGGAGVRTAASVVLVAAGLAALAVAGGGCGKGPQEATGPTFTVLSWNVNFGGPGAEEAVEVIARADADLVCLQEVTPGWEELIRGRLGGK